MTKFKNLIDLWCLEAVNPALRSSLADVREAYDERWDSMFADPVVVTAAVLGRETNEAEEVAVAEKFLQGKGVEIVKYSKKYVNIAALDLAFLLHTLCFLQ